MERLRILISTGSTWSEDESHLIPAISEALSQQLVVRFVIAPHEVDESHLQNLELNLKNKNLSYQRYSMSTTWSANSILIIDQIGILAEIYTWGKMAFVGGSFKKQVHSVMEPLAAGLFTLVGPFHDNNREAVEFQSRDLSHFPVVYQFNNWTEIFGQIKKISSVSTREMQKKIQSLIHEKSGATEKLLAYLERNIPL